MNLFIFLTIIVLITSLFFWGLHVFGAFEEFFEDEDDDEKFWPEKAEENLHNDKCNKKF